MNKEHTKQLVESCPILYRGGFGFECRDGWFQMISDLSVKLEVICEQALMKGTLIDDLPKASQVKEKFGSLRFYLSHGLEGMEELIDKAEDQSENICDMCGVPGDMHTDGGCYRVRCNKCKDKRR